MCLSNTLRTLNVHNVTHHVYSIEIFNSKTTFKLKKGKVEKPDAYTGHAASGFLTCQIKKVPEISAGFVGPEVDIIWRGFFKEKISLL